ncbi:MAG: hypothetical protein LBU45_01875, partial [Azoarcus sp.]|nr:hypothetical protein [Azoarcus sp.]
MTAYVRVCPVCDTENPLERAYCSHCASLLADVDFSLSRKSRESRESEGLAKENTPAPEAIPVRPAVPITVDAPPLTQVLSDALRCPDPECGQPNPPGVTRCLYCNTPLVASKPQPILPPTSASTFELEPPELLTTPPPSFSPAPRLMRVALPPALAARFRVLDEIAAASNEADLLIVEPVETTDA